MIAVTIAVGTAYQQMAKLAVESCKKNVGLVPIVISETPCKPAWYKLRLLDLFPGETILYFDADARFLRPWDVSVFEDTPWPVVVQDWPSTARNEDCGRYKIDRDRYFASGLWIANWRHRVIWRAAREIGEKPDYRTQFKYEQTALNTACQRTEIPLTFLPRQNWWIATLDHRAPVDTVTVALGGELNGPDREAYDQAIRRAAA